MKLLFVAVAILYSLIAEARLPDLIPYRKGELWGYCDSTKKIIIEPQFESVSEFSGSTALIHNANGYGIIDSRGRILLAPSYGYINGHAVNGCRIAAMHPEDNLGVINDSGQVIIPFEYIDLNWSGNFIIATREDRVGVFNSAGRVVIPFRYTARAEYADSHGDSGVFTLSRKRGRKTHYGLVDSTGKVLAPFVYDWVSTNGAFGFAAYREHEEEYIYYTASGQLIGNKNPAKRNTQPHPVWIYTEKGMRGHWADSNGVRMSKKEYMSTEYFRSGRACFYSMDSLFGYVNMEFVEVIPPVFAMAQNFNEQGLAYVTLEISPGLFRSGYIDTNGVEYWED